ncbi:hypothetical protein RHMOL_Rhmol06G0011800 [Rhododendron molle]|uniref:Uncharacterized protein n=1 Tax=Rhododendron molle TaxID=49168 RepID=A0ACC0N8D6_RHOML|nr:hypothetical protein RHMOL_Rhmol06G0011800 [Rhododendron molle]
MLKVKNVGPDPVLEVLLPFPDHRAKYLAYLAAATNEGKGKSKGPATSLPIEVVQPNEMPPALTWYSVSLQRGLGKGESLTLAVLAVFTHALRPFPEKISQAENQLRSRECALSFSLHCQDWTIRLGLVSEVVLPEGSKDVSVSAPFPVKQWHETKFSHLDIDGRPVVVLEKTNVVQEHSQYFQVYYKFNNVSLLRELLMLNFEFFMFIACIVYVHADLTISKSSASYVAKLQWDEVKTAIQQIQNSINRCLTVHDRLDAMLRDLSRTGDVQACKVARKATDSLLKDLSKELKPLLAFLHSSPQAAQTLLKVEDLVAKEHELQEKLMLKHSTVVEGYEKKSGGREMENRVALIRQKLTALWQEVDDLLEVIDEI